MKQNNLFKVTIKGFNYCHLIPNYGTTYVIANDPTEAYHKVMDFLNKEDIGSIDDRELEKIELIAKENNNIGGGNILFM
jgi:hypothetical protein